MSAFRLLLVEDSEQDRNACRDTVARYCDEKQRDIELIECGSVSEAFEKFDNSFDGAIIDLKLAGQGDEGNQVLSRIAELHFRIPVAVLTGTPDAANLEFAYIGVFKKGEPGAGYADLLDRFWGIYDTGLTRIMGGRGVIEETLSKVFQKNLLPQSDKWVTYGKINPSKTEKALLRHTLNHLLQLLEDDEERSFPEEMYLCPPLLDTIRTGSIIQSKRDEWFVVMNPACDLVIRRNGDCKTDRILLVEIEKEADVVSVALKNVFKSDKKKHKLLAVFGNNHANYYHWLPNTSFFCGGFLNFRKLSTITKDEFNKNFMVSNIQISPPFVKDMVARFSSYYARQGQPDIECASFIEHLISN